MNLGSDTFSFPVRQEGWQKKMLIGGLLVLFGWLIVPIFPLAGYGLRVMKFTARHGYYELPEWDDWGDLFAEGLRYYVVNFVYMIPTLLLICCAILAWVAPIPFMTDNPDNTVVAGFIIGQVVGYFFLGIGMLVGMVAGFFSLAAVSRMAGKDSLSAAFELSAVWQMVKAGGKHYIVAFVVYYGVSMAVGILSQVVIYTIILACLFPFLLAAGSYYMQVITGALYGLAYYQTQQDLDAPALVDMAAAE